MSMEQEYHNYMVVQGLSHEVIEPQTQDFTAPLKTGDRRAICMSHEM